MNRSVSPTRLPTALLAPMLAAVLSLTWFGCGSSGATSPSAGPDAQTTGPSIDGAPSDVNARGDEEGSSPDAATEQPAIGGYSLPSFEGGFDFYLSLPPDFSRFLPLYGDEVTREPPGFHDASSDEYFSYEFLWWLIDTPDLSTAALQDDLQSYYRGLCSNTDAVVMLEDPSDSADSGDETPGVPPADASAAESSATEIGGADAGAGILIARMRGTLQTSTCFDAPVPAASMDVVTYRCPDHMAVLVAISPQPPSSRVWSELYALRDRFVCW
jgi:hypothetical protein